MQFRSSTAFGVAALVSSAALVGACAATSPTGYTDDDAGIMTIDTVNDGGAIDTGTKPSNKDSGGDPGTPDGGSAGDPDAAQCVKDPPSNMCGVAPQCGCGLGETCDVTDNAGNVACVTAGLAAQGKACTGTAGCALGLTCLGGACRPYCPAGVASGAACGIGGTNVCFYVPDSSKNPIPNAHVCQITCDLVNPSSCDDPAAPAGIVGCDVDSKGNTDCNSAGTLKDTDATQCDGAHPCAPGYVCVGISESDGGTINLCKRWCKVGDNTPCLSGNKTCTGFQTKLLIGGTEYGSCP